MKLLFDENLAPRLVAQVIDLFPGSEHVRNVGLATADDAAVWEYAKAGGFAIVSKDADFRQLSFLYGSPPKSGSGWTTERRGKSSPSCGRMRRLSRRSKLIPSPPC